MIPKTIHQYLFFTVFIMFTFIGIQQLVFRKKLQLNYFLAALFLAGAYNMLYFWIFSLGYISRIPILLNSEIAAAFLIGPCLYLYFTALMGRVAIPAKSVFLHLLPFIISLTIITALNFSDDTMPDRFQNPQDFMPDYAQSTLILTINSLCDLSMAGYFLISALKTIYIMRTKKVTSETRAVIFFLIAFSISAALLMTAGFIRNPLMVQVSIVFLSILPLSFIFFSFRNPDYAIKVIKEARAGKTARAKELNQNTERIKTEIDRLMKDEKIYRQSDITLKTLGEKLSVSSHELSYILNSELNMNFNSYINYYRIEEAKFLLIEHNDRGVIKIAFDVGFNSTSAFYRYFQKHTGVSPKDYQKTGGFDS